MPLNPLALLHDQRIRFGLVGAVNTFIDLAIYTVLLPPCGIYVANLISTSCGMAAGYVLHRKFTFRVKTRSNHREVIGFFLITAVGLWILQPLVIYLTSGAIDSIVGDALLITIIPKIIAISVGLVWNYVWYNQTIFKNRGKHSDD